MSRALRAQAVGGEEGGDLSIYTGPKISRTSAVNIEPQGAPSDGATVQAPPWQQGGLQQVATMPAGGAAADTVGQLGQSASSGVLPAAGGPGAAWPPVTGSSQQQMVYGMPGGGVQPSYNFMRSQQQQQQQQQVPMQLAMAMQGYAQQQQQQFMDWGVPAMPHQAQAAMALEPQPQPRVVAASLFGGQGVHAAPHAGEGRDQCKAQGNGKGFAYPLPVVKPIWYRYHHIRGQPPAVCVSLERITPFTVTCKLVTSGACRRFLSPPAA